MSTQHRKGWHEINWATPRVLTDPEFVKNVVHPYDAIPSTGTFVAARVTGAPWQPCLSRVQCRSSAVTTWDAAVLQTAHELNQHSLAVSLEVFCSLPGITDTAVLLESGASSVPYEFLVLDPHTPSLPSRAFPAASRTERPPYRCTRSKKSAVLSGVC